MSTPELALEWIPGRFAICGLPAEDPIPAWASDAGRLISITRTDGELSIVAPQDAVPETIEAERGWAAMRVAGRLDFSMVGVLARLTAALAEAGVSVCAISTYDTDILLVRSGDSRRAVAALAAVADVTRLRAR